MASFKGTIGEITEVHERSGRKMCLEWRIPRFLDLPGIDYDCYNSPFFSFSGESWYLRLWPDFSKEVVVHLKYGENATTTLKVCVAVGVKGSNGVEKKREKEEEFYESSYCIFDHFCTRSELKQHSHRLMPGDALTIMCEIKILSTTARGGEKALQDFAKLLISGEGSDVTILVDDVQFKVHSFILFARCPALSASLQHECQEKASNTIVIEDCKPAVFQHFLHHLYTGTVQSFTEQTVFDLFRVADKYLVDDLKQQCLENIENTLSVQTFCDAMKLALLHGERDLLHSATDFAIKNTLPILHSVPWQNFLREYPVEANEIFIKSISPR